MSLIRRSHLPSFLFSTPPLPKAPTHPAVQDWLRGELLYTSHAKSLNHVARLLEKALARPSDTLDLSTASTMALDKVTPYLMQRVAEQVRHLRLPDDCPLDVAARWSRELPGVEITPACLAPKSLGRTAFIRRGGHGPRAGRVAHPVEPPRLPGKEGSPPSSPLLEAAQALRPMRAWLNLCANGEGQDSRTALSAVNADLLAKALVQSPPLLTASEKLAVYGSRGLLAARQPGLPLILTVDQAEKVSQAIETLERGAARAG
ncbi:hypothetical protein [Roseateles sp. L2-2]|uniref:hypothetical protein n=1 Tax=Roseateles sp. L2-2 TaxID=3422597 RepID=UPI003D36B069